MAKCSRCSLEKVRITTQVRLHDHVCQNKLLALGAYSEHICVYTVWLDVVCIEISVWIVDHVSQLLCCSPAILCPGKIFQSVSLQNRVVLLYVDNSLVYDADSSRVGNSQSVIVSQ